MKEKSGLKLLIQLVIAKQQVEFMQFFFLLKK